MFSEARASRASLLNPRDSDRTIYRSQVLEDVARVVVEEFGVHHSHRSAELRRQVKLAGKHCVTQTARQPAEWRPSSRLR